VVENRPQYLRALVAAAVVAFALAADALSFSNRFRSPRNPERPIRKSTRLVVLHTTEAHARSSLNKLCERGEAHYCVVENGTVYRIVDREREAFHAGRSMWNAKEDCDSYSVGIEVVGYHDKPVTLLQLDALRDLIDNLKKIYNLTDAQVVCHSHVAYGAPNKWQRRKHRGRKRCGMLFAMPSIRARLNLRSKPAFDPDVKAGRLVQADSYLGQVLYGSIDTMAGSFGRPVVAPAATPAPAKKGGILDSITRLFTKGELKNPSPPTKPAQPSVKPPVPKPQPVKQASTLPAAKPQVQGKAQDVPSTFVKGPLRGVPAQSDPTPSSPSSPAPSAPSPAQRPQPAAVDPVRNLAVLKALPGYVQGGPTSATLTPYKIAGRRWRSPDTYYYVKGKIISGDRIDEKKIGSGTLIFYRK
jgi:hypothetical protein